MIKCGDIMKTKIGNIEGMITCINDRFGAKTYELTYFDKEHKTSWFREPELEVSPSSKKEIGFKI